LREIITPLVVLTDDYRGSIACVAQPDEAGHGDVQQARGQNVSRDVGVRYAELLRHVLPIIQRISPQVQAGESESCFVETGRRQNAGLAQHDLFHRLIVQSRYGGTVTYGRRGQKTRLGQIVLRRAVTYPNIVAVGEAMIDLYIPVVGRRDADRI